MKVLLFYFSELGPLGGVAVAVKCLANEIVSRGHRAGIVEMGTYCKPRKVLQNGTPIWTISQPSNLTVRRPRSWASLVRSAWEFSRVLNEFKPDVVNIHFPLAQASPAVAVHLFPHHWKLVVSVHNSEIRIAPFEDAGLRLWQSRLFNRADAVTAVSDAMLKDTARLYPQIREKGRIIHNGVGLTWFDKSPIPPEQSQRYVLFAGRLARVKGVDTLLHAWKQIYHCVPGICLWIAGEGEEDGNLNDLAKSLGVTTSVRFLGRVSQTELKSLYRYAEVVILPSRFEGMPFAVLEALASVGLVIASKIPGVAELIEDGVTGYLVDPDTPTKLAMTILRTFKLSSESRSRITSEAQKSVKTHFSVDKMIATYLSLFDSLCGKRHLKKSLSEP